MKMSLPVMMDNVSVFRTAGSLQMALDKVRELKGRYRDIALVDKGSCFNRDLLDAYASQAITTHRQSFSTQAVLEIIADDFMIQVP